MLHKPTIPFFVLFLLALNFANAQRLQNLTVTPGKNPGTEKIEIHWRGIIKEQISDEINFQYLYFDGANISASTNFLPEYYFTKLLQEVPEVVETKLFNEVYEELSPEEISVLTYSQNFQPSTFNFQLSTSISIKTSVNFHRKKPQLEISFIPIRKNATSGKFEKLISFQISTDFSGAKKKTPSSRTSVSSSVLSSGDWYKIGVAKEGIYKISYSFLKNMGMDLANINPQNIRIYGNGGGMLPVENSQERTDDLAENAIMVIGESDGKFDAQDYVLFYGQSPHRWNLYSDNLFYHQQNLYSDTNYYFITADWGAGKRVQPQNSLSSFTKTVISFNDYEFYERDVFNPLKSGRGWLGEIFSVVNDYDFVFSFPNISNSPVTGRAVVAGRTTGGQNTFTIKANGQNIGNINISSVSGSYTDIFARTNEIKGSVSSSSSNLNIHVSMSKGNSSAQGWLDFIEVNARRNLIFSGDQILFRDVNSLGNGNAKFSVSNVNANILIWEITNPSSTKNQLGNISGNIFEFIAATDSLKEFAVFDKTSALLAPSFIEKVNPQNLHALQNTQMLIVTHSLFLEEAKQLADFHRTEDGLSVNIATTAEIFNEFSSGKQDVTAIKDFVKMFYDRAANNDSLMPKYLLLFGDGSYDYKDKISGNTNFVPSYQSLEYLAPTATYVSDDYFGLLDDSEGESTSNIVDIGIGRLVVKNREEAQNALNKIKHYYKKETMGPWRNYLTFIGDDEDGNIHMSQANGASAIIENNYKKYNIDKIFFDAYKQQVNAGGQRYPDVNAAIDRRIDLGTLMFTYIGHGGELGWSHERVLEVAQINKWNNFNNMPLFITATCEFSRFDDPQRTSAGEFVFLNPNGGGIGLLTTTRLVYSSPNFEIVQAFLDSAFEEINAEIPRLGDILKITKIKGPKNINTRNFTLLGDPALRLAYPRYNVVTTFVSDTMKALRKITVKGFVADDNNQKMTDFNGVVYPTIFDKAATINTLNNDGTGIFSFQSQKNVLFKGKASVKNGDFEYSFVVPKDITYNYGFGRISHYGQNGETDASGYYENFIIGGSDSTALADNSGPQIQLFLNDEKFVFGGITDENPKLFAKLFDDSGINTTGNGIGHDIVAVLDANTSQSIVLNDYYEAEINSYQRGAIKFPLKDLSEGTHILSLKAFDVYNNSGEANTEFVVAKSAELALEHVLNYPNPFTTNTAFYFEHNMPGQNLDISIQIFTVSGKLLKSIDSYVNSDSFRAGPFYWDGLDDYGDKIGKGVYLYKLKVIAPTGNAVSKFEKLVVLN